MRGKKEESSLLCVVLCVSSFFLRLITYLGVIDFFEEADLFFFVILSHMFNKVTLYSPKDSKAILLLVTKIDPLSFFFSTLWI